MSHMHGATRKCKGFMALVLGVLFLLGTLGVWPEFTFATYWPLFPIIWGLHGLLCPCGKQCCGGKCDDKK